MVPAPSMPDLQTEAMDLAEKGAKLACGSRFKRLPRLILRKLTLPVVAVIGIIWFVYAEAMAVATRWMENSVPGVMNTGVLSFNAGVGFLMYLCCVYRDPGRVPTAWRPPALNDLETGDESGVDGGAHHHGGGHHGGLQELKRKGGARYCKKCAKYKPPRTHHCRVCNRCVLRMDHHCVWVNNCIGHRNYKSFFTFLFYITVACCHAFGILAGDAIGRFSGGDDDVGKSHADHRVNHGEDDSVAASVAEMAALILSLCLSVALCLLFGWHCYLVVNNKTTIEHYEGVRSRLVGPKPGDDGQAGGDGYAPSLDGVQHPYSLGARANLREILGRRVACWLAPGCSIAGDGLSFANVASMGYARWAEEKALRESELTLMGED
mmetsp:Transcript_4597/g.17200  ORF Transcript_4597/g.17200 Transcript_4597/m.17200 type:complete len:379 (-) Transcript_4597:47-1183(-)